MYRKIYIKQFPFSFTPHLVGVLLVNEKLFVPMQTATQQPQH